MFLPQCQRPSFTPIQNMPNGAVKFQDNAKFWPPHSPSCWVTRFIIWYTVYYLRLQILLKIYVWIMTKSHEGESEKWAATCEAQCSSSQCVMEAFRNVAAYVTVSVQIVSQMKKQTLRTHSLVLTLPSGVTVRVLIMVAGFFEYLSLSLEL